MKRLFYLMSLAVVVTLFASCTKEVLVTTGEVIAEKVVPAEAGSFPVAITTKGVWQATPVDSWLHVEEGLVNGDYAIMISYDSNESTAGRRNFNRVGSIVIATYDKYTADTIRVKQRGLTPFMQLKSVVVEATATQCTIPFDTNLTHEQHPSIVCRASEPWVSSVAISASNQSLDLLLEENRGVERQATIEVTFTDAWGEAMTTSCTLTQKQSE